MVAAWLAHPTYGVNAVLAALPTDGNDPIPASVTVIEETTNQRAAVGRPDDELDPDSHAPDPVLAVVGMQVDDATPQIPSPVGDVTVGVLIRFEGRYEDASAGRRDAYQTLRAVTLSLRKFTRDGDPVADRTRNDVALIDLEELRIEPGPVQLAETGIYGQVLASWKARDLTSL